MSRKHQHPGPLAATLAVLVAAGVVEEDDAMRCRHLLNDEMPSDHFSSAVAKIRDALRGTLPNGKTPGKYPSTRLRATLDILLSTRDINKTAEEMILWSLGMRDFPRGGCS